MSLILDALKKAEQDRHAGQAPVIDEMLVRNHRPVIARRRNQQQEVAVMAAIIASVLFALAGLVYWLWPASPKTVAVVVAPTPAPPAAETTPAAPLRVDPERLEAPIGDAPEVAVDMSDTGATQAMTMDELDDDAPAAAPVKPAPATPPAAPPVAAAAAIEQPLPTATPQSEPPAVRPLKEMPPAFRSEFPKLTLDIHVYDDNPLRRFALINGKKYRETDTLLDGPRLVEIRPDGVVLEQRGSKVLLELPR